MVYSIRELREEKERIKREQEKNKITDEEFNSLITEIYQTMLDYSRERNVHLNKMNPIEIGGILFWFETNIETNESFVKFNRSKEMWDKDSITADLSRYYHALFYQKS